LFKAGSNMEISTAMMPITTSNSTRVKARLCWEEKDMNLSKRDVAVAATDRRRWMSRIPGAPNYAG
jgi:hypothetical protein